MNREALIEEMNRLKKIHYKTGIIELRDRIIEIQNELKRTESSTESKNTNKQQIKTTED